jgi:hypothetical protein
MEKQKIKYIIIARDRTHIDKPIRLFIQNNLEEYQHLIDFLKQFWDILYHGSFNDICLNGGKMIEL